MLQHHYSPARKNSNAVEEIKNEYANSSPYYRGLTNFTKPHQVSNPNGDNKSDGSSVMSSSSYSNSNYITKIQCWTYTCFGSAPNSDSAIANPNQLENRKATASLSPRREWTVKAAAAAAVLNAKVKSENEEERRFVWADKYRPNYLKDFICNRNKAIELQDMMAKGGECREFIFAGLPGAGKRSMIWALLRHAFGSENIQTRDECKEFSLKGEAVSSIRVNVKESQRHVEVDLAQLEGYEKQVLFELIKETNTRLADKALKCTHDQCRAIVLYGADKLSSDAVLHVKWLLQRYKGCNKVFFCCTDISKLDPILPLCNIVQLNPPSQQEIVEVLEFIAEKEGIELTYKLAERIATGSNNNLQQAIRSFEATWLSNSFLKEDQAIMTGWEDDISSIAKQIVQDQSAKQLYTTRGKLQILIKHNVSPQFITKTLVDELKKNVEERLHNQLDSFYKEHNKRNEDMQKQLASKYNNDPRKRNIEDYMRVEEFIARFMSRYKNCFAHSKCNFTHYQKI